MDLEYKKYYDEYDNLETFKPKTMSFFDKVFSRDSTEKKNTEIKQHNQYLILRCQELELDKQYLQKSYNLLLLKYQVVHEFAFE
tara:strand:+ start:2413 stop:2664 length:252 start_codon:yes stop_codon:yes gene_type:complete